MNEKNITFEDLPKAMSWMMDKLNELDSKIDGLNNQNQSVPVEQWMTSKNYVIICLVTQQSKPCMAGRVVI